MGDIRKIARPKFKLLPPKVSLENDGLININAPDKNVKIFYTLDGANPSENSLLYTKPFKIDKHVTIKTFASSEKFFPSAIVEKFFYKPIKTIKADKREWKVLKADSYEQGDEPEHVIDGDLGTIWHTEWWRKSPSHPHFIEIDLGAMYEIAGVVITPRVGGSTNGSIKDYELYLSENGNNWGTPTCKGKFKSPTKPNTLRFEKNQKCRYIKLVALSAYTGPWTSLAEFDILALRKIE